ncbi:MAG: preprotein translocase subunit SecY [Verrucomicrobia bacterium]|nr:preprotein translocase subunit SecY [Verrucomicrobiota bacterium]MBS0635935.1 preprotein translocase subunit SecY [Verrucomicrobiota bacterium]
MFATLTRIFQVPELQKKIVFTLLLLVVYRVGGFIPVPGINGEVALAYFREATGGGQNLFQLVDIFSGGAFSQMTIFALGVVPYISASIILQLLVALIPSLQREIRENPELGRRKVNRWTRYGTLILSFFQATLFAKYAQQINMSNPGIISPELLEVQAFGVSWLFYAVMVITMTTGTMFLMWVGEQITEKGIGNGMSLIITVGILSSLPSTMGLIMQQLNLDSPEAGQISFFSLLVLFSLFVLVIMATIYITQGQRRIPLQYARRVVGNKEVQGMGSSYIPLKVNYAGVIPVIFASSLLMFPATIGQFVGLGNWMGQVANWLSPGSSLYVVTYMLLIIFFTYFWTATQFRPDQIASDMKKNGAFIPGIKQGKHTQDYLEQTMSRITLIGALLLALLAVLPQIVSKLMNVSTSISYFFGGTSLLILVGVVLDTMKQIESHLLMKRYDGFMKKGRVRS